MEKWLDRKSTFISHKREEEGSRGGTKYTKSNLMGCWGWIENYIYDNETFSGGFGVVVRGGVGGGGL